MVSSSPGLRPAILRRGGVFFMIDKQTGLWIYNKMHEIRDFEETAWTLFTENKLRGSVHLYTGEEAIAASICAQLTDEDLIASTHLPPRY